jgi:hypothetical protein
MLAALRPLRAADVLRPTIFESNSCCKFTPTVWSFIA